MSTGSARTRLAMTVSAMAIMLVTTLSGCAAGPSATSPSPSPSSATPSTSISTEATVSPTPSDTDDDAMIGHQASPVNVYWVLEGDDGASGPAVGCGDSLVMSSIQGMDPALTGAVRVEAAIEALLAHREREVGERDLINALHHSELTVDSAQISDTTVTVRLSGKLASAGTCDDPRIIEQLKQTAQLNADVPEARILVNGTPIEDLLTAQG